jgi:hypothetical protein
LRTARLLLRALSCRRLPSSSVQVKRYLACHRERFGRSKRLQSIWRPSYRWISVSENSEYELETMVQPAPHWWSSWLPSDTRVPVKARPTRKNSYSTLLTRKTTSHTDSRIPQTWFRPVRLDRGRRHVIGPTAVYNAKRTPTRPTPRSYFRFSMEWVTW